MCKETNTEVARGPLLGLLGILPLKSFKQERDRVLSGADVRVDVGGQSEGDGSGPGTDQGS